MTTNRNCLKGLMATGMLLMMQAMSFAQDATTGTGTNSGSGSTSTTQVEITADTGNWFGDNWLWIVGAIVFIILLFALIGGGGRRSTTVVREDAGTGRVTRTTTVDDDV